jgi:DNA-binding CsgD family transcriptional regulator
MNLADFYTFRQNTLQEKCITLLSLIVFSQACMAAYFEVYKITYWMLIISIFLSIINHASIKYKQNYIRLAFYKPLVFTIHLMLLCLVFYFDMNRGMDFGFYLYYFPILISIPFFFDCNAMKKQIGILFLTAIVMFYFTTYHRFGFNRDYQWDINTVPTHFRIELKGIYYKLHFVTTLLFIFLFLYFIYQKENLFDAIYLEYNQKQEYNQQLEKINKHNFDDILTLAKQNDPLFLIEFTQTYPDFIDYLDENHTKLTPAELKLCAYMRLNFSTKDVACICNISVRTVQNTKYAIRKKLKIESNNDIYQYIQGI